MRQLPISIVVVCLGLGSVFAQGPSWSTYYGGTGDERCASRGVLRLPNGNVVVVGPTSSTNLNVPGAIQPTYGGGPSDGFIACFDPTLTGQAQCVWATYLGGSGYDEINGVTLAPNGEILVCGYTDSPTFPTTSGCLQPRRSGVSDGFVARLSVQGGAPGLVWSTCLGGPGNAQSAVAVAVQSTGDIVVAGSSDAGFPAANPSTCPPYQANNGGMPSTLDGVVAVLDSAGSILRARTYFGLAGTDTITCLTLDSDRPVLGGVTNTGIATTPGAYQPAFAGWQDGFVARFSASLCVLQYATHLGGAGNDFAQAIEPAPGGCYAVGGWAGPLRTTNGSSYAGGPFDAFLALLDPTQTGLQQCVWASLYGGAQSDGIWDLAVDPSGLITVAGETSSTSLPTRSLTTGALQTRYGGGSTDVWIARIDPQPQPRTNREVLYATYLGGSGDDRGFGVTLDEQGDPILAGSTTSPNWRVTPGACQSTYGGGTPWSPTIPLSGLGDVFVTELPLLPAGATRYGVATPGCYPQVPIGVNSAPVAGNAAFEVFASGSQPSTPAFLVFGRPSPCSPLLNVSLCVNPVLVGSFVVGDPTGFVHVPVPLPLFPPPPYGIGVQWLFPNCVNNQITASEAVRL